MKRDVPEHCASVRRLQIKTGASTMRGLSAARFHEGRRMTSHREHHAWIVTVSNITAVIILPHLCIYIPYNRTQYILLTLSTKSDWLRFLVY